MVDEIDKQNETTLPEIEPSSLTPPEKLTTEPFSRWIVLLKCKIAFNPIVFLAAWKARLPTLSPLLDGEASDDQTTFFEVAIIVQSQNRAKAVDMAVGLLQRHFDSLIVRGIEAERSKD